MTRIIIYMLPGYIWSTYTLTLNLIHHCYFILTKSMFGKCNAQVSYYFVEMIVYCNSYIYGLVESFFVKCLYFTYSSWMNESNLSMQDVYHGTNC